MPELRADILVRGRPWWRLPLTAIPVAAILEGARSARYFTVIAPLTAWSASVYAASKEIWWLAIPVAILAVILSLPHAIAHLIAARDMWRARNHPAPKKTGQGNKRAGR
jgi:lysylphosphatidylglycerol synthetase-like protein (DUF2156 family)